MNNVTYLLDCFIFKKIDTNNRTQTEEVEQVSTKNLDQNFLGI